MGAVVAAAAFSRLLCLLSLLCSHAGRCVGCRGCDLAHPKRAVRERLARFVSEPSDPFQDFKRRLQEKGVDVSDLHGVLNGFWVKCTVPDLESGVECRAAWCVNAAKAGGKWGVGFSLLVTEGPRGRA